MSGQCRIVVKTAAPSLVVLTCLRRQIDEEVSSRVTRLADCLSHSLGHTPVRLCLIVAVWPGLRYERAGHGGLQDLESCCGDVPPLAALGIVPAVTAAQDVT